MENLFVKRVTVEIENRVAFVRIAVGEVEINGISLYKLPNGKLRVSWPTCWTEIGKSDTISIPLKLRKKIETEIIAAYDAAKEEYDARMARKCAAQARRSPKHESVAA